MYWQDSIIANILVWIIDCVFVYWLCICKNSVFPGIMVEGFGCILAGLWGTGSGTTSYSQNIAAIGITRVSHLSFNNSFAHTLSSELKHMLYLST